MGVRGMALKCINRNVDIKNFDFDKTLAKILANAIHREMSLNRKTFGEIGVTDSCSIAQEIEV